MQKVGKELLFGNRPNMVEGLGEKSYLERRARRPYESRVIADAVEAGITSGTSSGLCEYCETPLDAKRIAERAPKLCQECKDQEPVPAKEIVKMVCQASVLAALYLGLFILVASCVLGVGCLLWSAWVAPLDGVEWLKRWFSLFMLGVVMAGISALIVDHS